jgi:transposase InsO family protein
VSKSGYYAWKRRPKSKRTIDNEGLLVEIRRVFLENRHNYGSPRIYRAIRKKHITCFENRIARLMRLDNLVAVQKRKFKATTNSKHNWPVALNLLERNFTTDEPNKV